MVRLPVTVEVQTFPATDVQPTHVGDRAVAPGAAVSVTVVDPVKVTVPEQLAVLLVAQLMAGVVWPVATRPGGGTATGPRVHRDGRRRPQRGGTRDQSSRQYDQTKPGSAHVVPRDPGGLPDVCRPMKG
jgi:hypothetical protein